MPFNSKQDLPERVRNVLPTHAQDIYKDAFNNAFQQYKDPDDRQGESSREEVAHKVAWGAVKRNYHKESDGKWHPNQ